MFKVWEWQLKKAFMVYDVKQELGVAYFLVYDGTAWIYRKSFFFDEYTWQDVYPFDGERKDNE